MTEEKLFALFQPHLFLMMLTFFSRRSKKKKPKTNQDTSEGRVQCWVRPAGDSSSIFKMQTYRRRHTHTHIYIAWTQRAHTGQTLPNPQYFNILLMRYSAFRLISILLQPELMSSFFFVETTSFPETLFFFWLLRHLLQPARVSPCALLCALLSQWGNKPSADL